MWFIERQTSFDVCYLNIFFPERIEIFKYFFFYFSPLDVLKTRVMLDRGTQNRQLLPHAVEIFKNEGIVGLFFFNLINSENLPGIFF